MARGTPGDTAPSLAPCRFVIVDQCDRSAVADDPGGPQPLALVRIARKTVLDQIGQSLQRIRCITTGRTNRKF